MTSQESKNRPEALALKIGFIGSGQMALALARGFMASGLIGASQVLASAPSDNNLKTWRQLGVETTHSNADIVKQCDVIFFAVKPHIFPKVMRNLRDACETVDELVSDFGSYAFLCYSSFC